MEWANNRHEDDKIGSCLRNGQVLRLKLYDKALESARKKRWSRLPSTKDAVRVRVGMAYAKAHPESRSKYHQVLRMDERDRKRECPQTTSSYIDGSHLSCICIGDAPQLGSEAARSASNNGGEGVSPEGERVAGTRICIWTKMWNSAAVKYERDLDPNMSVAELRKELQVHVVAKTEGTEGKFLKRICSIGENVSIGKANTNIGSCLRNGEVLRLILLEKNKKKNVRS